MRRALLFIILSAVPLLYGCSKQDDDREKKISAKCERMNEASDKPMEDIVDDDQGVIYF